MRDEIVRILSAGQTGAPAIVPGVATGGSGAGVGSTVFPPVDAAFQAPPAHSLQQPYQAPQTPAPSPYAQPSAAQQQPGYAYPPTAQAPQHQHQYAPQTPPPFTISPSPAPAAAASSGGGKKNMPVVVGAIAVALVAIGGLIAVLNMGDDPKDKNKAAGPGASSSASASAVAGHKGPDPSRTIDAEQCKSPTKSFRDATKVVAPDFRYKNLLSVKLCIQAAGWRYKITERDEAIYGQDTVLEQLPEAGTDVAKDGTEFTLIVSTGDPS